MDLAEISSDLKTSPGNAKISVRSGFFGFLRENPTTDPPFLGSGGRELSLTVTRVESAGCQAGSDEFGLVGRVTVLLDTLLRSEISQESLFHEK